jgi:hypothetical protein
MELRPLTCVDLLLGRGSLLTPHAIPFFSPALLLAWDAPQGLTVHLPLHRVGATHFCIHLLSRALTSLSAFPYRLCLLCIACNNKYKIGP